MINKDRVLETARLRMRNFRESDIGPCWESWGTGRIPWKIYRIISDGGYPADEGSGAGISHEYGCVGDRG